MQVNIKILTDKTHFIIKATGHTKNREDCARITTAFEVFANQNANNIVIFNQQNGKTFITGKKQVNYYNFVKYLYSLNEHYTKTIKISEVHHE